MQNADHTTKTMFVQPSLRPEIEIHDLDYDFPKMPARPIVRTGDDAIKNTTLPGIPASAQDASSAQTAITAPTYKAVPPPPAQDKQQSTTASETTAVVSTRPTTQYTARTFADAVLSGDLDAVQRHIDARLDVNVRLTLYPATALMYAAAFGHQDIVRQLLAADASVNQTDGSGWTALMFAARNGHTAIVQALLFKGATVDLASNYGVTALMFASRYGRTATVQALLAKGATVDLVSTDGMTALMAAAEDGHTEIVQLLLEAGGNCKLKDKHGNTALNLAIKRDRKEVVKLLRVHEAPTSPQPGGLFQHLFG